MRQYRKYVDESIARKNRQQREIAEQRLQETQETADEGSVPTPYSVEVYQ